MQSHLILKLVHPIPGQLPGMLRAMLPGRPPEMLPGMAACMLSDMSPCPLRYGGHARAPGEKGKGVGLAALPLQGYVPF